MLEQLHRRYGEQVRFVSIYVREAHPGEHLPQPRTMAEKLAHARYYALRDRVSWTVAVDDLEGSLHRALGTVPDPAMIVDESGAIAHTVLWSNDARGIEAALRAVLAGAPHARRARKASVVPSLRSLGVAAEVMEAAGPRARKDFRRVLPAVAGVAAVARRFGRLERLSPVGRSVAALIGVGVGVMAAVVLLRAVRRR